MFSIHKQIFMPNWVRDILSKLNVSRPSTSLSQESDSNNSMLNNTRHADQTSSKEPNKQSKISLRIVFEGDIWIVNVEGQPLISDIIVMALGHFLNPSESHSLVSKYKLIVTDPARVLCPQYTIIDEGLKNNDEILLVASLPTGAAANPVSLSLQDIQGPSKEEIKAATASLPKKNPPKVFPALDCQDNFISEIRKVLYSLVEVSARILSQSPDAKILFDGIAARITAKNNKEIDKNAIKYLKDIGFSENQARYALRLKRNKPVEAMEWLLENSHRVKDDALEEGEGPSTSTQAPVESGDPLHTINKLLHDIREFQLRHFEPSSKALESLREMGFDEDSAVEALRATDNNVVAASEYLCGDRDPSLPKPEPGLSKDSPVFQALMNNPAIQLGLHKPKIMLAFLSILENPSNANLWLNDVETAPVLGQVFKTYHSEKHIMVCNQQLGLVQQQQQQQSL